MVNTTLINSTNSLFCPHCFQANFAEEVGFMIESRSLGFREEIIFSLDWPEMRFNLVVHGSKDGEDSVFWVYSCATF